jgi:hypothetical protein
MKVCNFRENLKPYADRCKITHDYCNAEDEDEKCILWEIYTKLKSG